MSKVMKNVNLHKEIYSMQAYKHQQPCYVLILFLHFLLYIPYTLDLTAPTTREHFFVFYFRLHVFGRAGLPIRLQMQNMH